MASREVRAMTPTSAAPTDSCRAGFRRIRDARGFTLLELLVVLTLLAIGMTLVIPSITSNESKQFRAQVGSAVSMLHYARRIAIVQAMPGIATFSSAVEDRDDRGPSSNAAAETKKTRPNSISWHSRDLALRYQAGLDGSYPEDVDNVEVIFFPQGGSTGGILHFVRGDLEARIKVDPITGRITTRYDHEEFDD